MNELNVTPESLTARIGSLNQLTSDLNEYLKEYIMSEGFDRLKEELEKTTLEMTAKVESLEAQISDKENQHSEQVRSLTVEYEAKGKALNEKLEQAKENFETEKIKISQLYQDQLE